MQLDDSFLDLPVESWHENQSYLTASTVVRRLVSVNDCAKRGTALIQHFNETTIDETLKQYLLQVVENHRKNFFHLAVKAMHNLQVIGLSNFYN